MEANDGNDDDDHCYNSIWNVFYVYVNLLSWDFFDCWKICEIFNVWILLYAAEM